jgi:hypothetical protein
LKRLDANGGKFSEPATSADIIKGIQDLAALVTAFAFPGRDRYRRAPHQSGQVGAVLREDPFLDEEGRSGPIPALVPGQLGE